MADGQVVTPTTNGSRTPEQTSVTTSGNVWCQVLLESHQSVVYRIAVLDEVQVAFRNRLAYLEVELG